MQLYGREARLISAFLISMSLLLSAVISLHVAEVTLTPTQTSPDKVVEFSLSVKNTAGDSINKVEITIPQKDNTPLYLVKEIGNPAGWTYETRFSLGAPTPFKIIWFTAAEGITVGKSLNFNFVAISPSAVGDYVFEWKTTDVKGAEAFGSIKVTNFAPVLASLDLKAPSSVSAGKEFDLTVTALDQNGNRKTDYTGTVKFSSSDPLAILPADYTFQAVDRGTKTFKIKLKTAGDQEVKVFDGSIEKSVKIKVLQGDVARIELKLSSDIAPPNTHVDLTVLSSDVYGNIQDVTNFSTFEIDKEAKGRFDNNTYITEVTGNWTIIVTYIVNTKKFVDGALLTVTTVAPPPEEVIVEEKKPAMEIVSEDSVTITVNTTKLFSLTVKNTGEVDLKNVSLVYTGFPVGWVSISPSLVDIDKGKSARLTATITTPEKIEPANVEFLALSSKFTSEELNATKVVKFNITEAVVEAPPVGRFVLGRNVTYLGIAIVVAVILILLFWALFLREAPKKKKSEV